MADAEKFERVLIKRLKPYKNNAKEHSKRQIDAIKKSIKKFGFINPILIDRDYNVIAGHGRITAAKSLRLKKVPCVFVEGLTDEQRRAYILADNKLAELSTWDEDLLKVEIEKLPEIDMSDFGFDIDDLDFNLQDVTADQNENIEEDDEDEDEDGYYGDARESTFSQYNLRDFDPSRCDGKYQIPMLDRVDHVPKSLIGFNYAKTSEDTSAGIHFFIDDYQFERVWRQPDHYIEILSKFDCVLTPDFSLYLDMPMAMKIWNRYRSQLIGQMCQDAGLIVIPTLTWAEPETYDFCFDGIPKYSTVATSTVGVMREESSREIWQDGMHEALKRLRPKNVICYGTPIDGFDFGKAKVTYIKARAFEKDV